MTMDIYLKQMGVFGTNYYEGKRNGHRVLWSNDGLMFVTYDHYETFYEIIGEKNYEQRKNHCFRFN